MSRNFQRREFLGAAGSCAAHLALAALALPVAARRSWAHGALGHVVAREPFGRLERVAEGVWALISTPLSGDRTTLSNGGLIAGRSGVLAIEGFMTPEGAAWLSAQSKSLTGMVPSHVVVTHYHSDHANGVAGYSAEMGQPAVHATPVTRELVLTRNQPTDTARTSTLRGASVMDPMAEEPIDLGGRTVRLIPRRGHTQSDVTVEIDDPSVVFCGDLVWNAMFPNFVDAVPSQLAGSVATLRRQARTTYVPGHGTLSTDDDLQRYIAMLAEVERAARDAHQRGVSAVDAAATFRLPETLGEWTSFSRAFHQRAFEAWNRELSGAR
jgi:glyoxylase-like metal-dependent hydrolase (beta-lactamase superfamily II)